MFKNIQKLRCYFVGTHRFVRTGSDFVCIDCGLLKKGVKY